MSDFRTGDSSLVIDPEFFNRSGQHARDIGKQLGRSEGAIRAFPDTATRELVIRLHNELQIEIRGKHTEIMAQFKKLQIRSDKEASTR